MDERVRRHNFRDDVLLVTLDVKNAFNCARWDDIIRSLEQDFLIPRYLGNVLKDYLRDRNCSTTRSLAGGREFCARASRKARFSDQTCGMPFTTACCEFTSR